MKALLISLLIPLLGSNLFNDREIGSFFLDLVNKKFDCRLEISKNYYLSEDIEVKRRLKESNINYGNNILPANHGLLLRHFNVSGEKNKYSTILEEAFKTKIKYISVYSPVFGWYTTLETEYGLWFYYGNNDYLLGDICVNIYIKELIKQGKSIQWCKEEIRRAYLNKFLYDRPQIILPINFPIPFYLTHSFLYEIECEYLSEYSFPLPMNNK